MFIVCCLVCVVWFVLDVARCVYCLGLGLE